MMKFLADENVEKPIVDFLRLKGVDVAYVAEQCPGCSDDKVFALARDQNRILITNDRDFGEIAFRRKEISFGIVLMRFSSESMKKKMEVLKHLLRHHSKKLAYHFTVVTESQIRIRPITAE